MAVEAERRGFEPRIHFWRIHTFQACSLNHSDISPLPAIARSAKAGFLQPEHKVRRRVFCSQSTKREGGFSCSQSTKCEGGFFYSQSTKCEGIFLLSQGRTEKSGLFFNQRTNAGLFLQPNILHRFLPFQASIFNSRQSNLLRPKGLWRLKRLKRGAKVKYLPQNTRP